MRYSIKWSPKWRFKQAWAVCTSLLGGCDEQLVLASLGNEEGDRWLWGVAWRWCEAEFHCHTVVLQSGIAGAPATAVYDINDKAHAPRSII